MHLPEKKFLTFRIAWNLLCGIPFLVPSFTYYPHLDHHRRKMFGTEHDGEYLPLASMSPWAWVRSSGSTTARRGVVRRGVKPPDEALGPAMVSQPPASSIATQSGIIPR